MDCTRHLTANVRSKPMTVTRVIQSSRKVAAKNSIYSHQTVRSSNILETKSMAHVMIVTPAGSNQGTFCLSSQAVAGSRVFPVFWFLLWLFPALAAGKPSQHDCLDF